MLISKAQLARQLGVSRTYITLLAQGKRKPSKQMVGRLAALGLTANVTANTGTHEYPTFNSVLMVHRYFKVDYCFLFVFYQFHFVLPCLGKGHPDRPLPPLFFGCPLPIVPPKPGRLGLPPLLPNSLSKLP